MPEILLRAGDVVLRRPTAADADEFLRCVEASAERHRDLVEPPSSRRAFDAYLRRISQPASDGFLVRTARLGRLVGVVNVNGVTRGGLQSATLGYYRLSGAGPADAMTDAVGCVVAYCFADLHLHRVEANVQPQNEASRAILRAVGFRQEGFSEAYLRIAGHWRDHERWAIVNPD